MMSDAIAKVVDKVVDLLFSDAASRAEAKRTRRREVVAILEQIWKTAEEVHMEIRGLDRPDLGEPENWAAKERHLESIRGLNRLIAQNELTIDRALYPLVQDYFDALFRLCETVDAYGSVDDRIDLASSAIRPAVDLEPLVGAYAHFNAKRDAVLTFIKTRIAELSDG